MTALKQQVGGDHYSKLAIQPVEYINKNNLTYLQGNVIKYVTRYKDKNGVEDLQKAKHYIDLLIELEDKNEKKTQGVMQHSNNNYTSACHCIIADSVLRSICIGSISR